MRIIQNEQMQFGQTDISEIKFNEKSRDDIPQILKGLQFLYMNTSIRDEIFNLLQNKISPNTNKNTGRPGMDLWKIFVMGVLRVNLNYDYDRLHDCVNNHKTIRQMLGHGLFDDDLEYELQTIKDNVKLLTSELLDEINQIVVKAGHGLVKKKDNEPLKARADSFVVETNVHFPTDINLLFDAMRKVISLSFELCNSHGLSIWRQEKHNIRQVKRAMRKAQNKKRSNAKSEASKASREALIIDAHQEYINTAQVYLNKAKSTLEMLTWLNLSAIDLVTKNTILVFINHADRQINQINRRVINGETIPHNEKVFSLFQPHTEWISKGKAGVPVELGLRVCILEDQYQFILHHKVMEKQTDDQVAVPIIREAKHRFPSLISCSFDKGFHSPENQKILSEELELAVIPRKGKLSIKSREIENADDFISARKQHSAVESAINALEVHGLDVCLDHGIDGFNRYVSLAIVARNIQLIGVIIKNLQNKSLKLSYSYRGSTIELAA